MFSSLLRHSFHHLLTTMVDDMNDTQIKDVDGILECNDMKLKKDVAQAYVPVEIRKGHISSCRIRCDWNALLSHPIEIEINGVHIECTSIEKKKSPEVSILSSIESQLLSQQSSHGYIDGWIKRMIQHVKITVNDVHITYVTPSPSSSPFTLGVALTSLVITSTSNNTKSCSIDGFTSYLIIGDVENESTTPMSFQQRLDEWSMISPAPSPSLLIASPAAASASLPPPFPYLLRPTSIHFNVSLQPRLSITSTLPDLMIETTEEQLQILITWIQHMMTSSTSHGRIGTVQDREKYIPLYQRTLSWKGPLTSEERETLTQLENDIRIQNLIRWRKQAFHQLQHAIAPHQVTRRGEYVDTITKGWQKLQHLSPWMAKLISTATSWGWSQTSSETPITDQQANELIQSLHLDEDVKNEDDKIELNITTKSFTFQIASNRGDLVTRLTIPSSSITYQHEISDTTPNTHINASTPNVMISLSQPRTNASLMDLTTVLTLELTQPIWDMKWSYDDTADVMTSRMTLTLVDITLSDWLQTNPHLRRVMYTRHDDDPLHDTLIGLEWKQIRVSSSPSQHVVTCNIHTLHTQYNPHTVKVMWETWRQLQIRLHMSRSPPSSPPQHDRQGSLTPRLTSQSIIPFHTPNMDLTFHLALQHFTLSLNKDTKLHPRRILSMDIHGVDVTTSFQPPMYIDVRLKKLRIISAMNRINDVDMITSDTSIQPCFHMKYTGTTNTDIQSSFYLRTGKYHMMYQHQWILELLDYTREAIINVLTPFTIPIPMPSRPADSTAAASPDPRTPTTKSPKLSPRTIASPGVASRSLLRCIPTGTGELLRVPSAGEVSRPGSPVLGSPRRHSVPTITSTSTPGSPVAGSPLQARRALRRPLHISTTDLNTDEHSIPTPQPIQPQQQPQKHITRFPKMNIEMDNVIVTIPGITDKSDALMITLGTCSIQEASDSTSQIQHMICSLGTTNADIHHTDGTTSSLFKNITFSLDIKHIIHQHHSHMDMIGTVSPCVITFTPSTLLTCVSLIEHHVASHIITSTPSSPHEMSHPRLYTLADEIIYKYGIDNIRPSRTYTSIDDVMSHHVHLKMSDITITASSHNDSITRLSLYDVVMDSSRDTGANITTTYRMNHIGLIYENGTISHQLISRDDIKQSHPHLTWEQIYVVCDENNESRISYVITCHGLHITIIPEIITSYMHYLPIHTTRMLISTLSTYIPSLIERTCDHHSLIVELYGCRIALYQSSAKDAHRIIISHDLNLQYESSLVQSSCTLSLHDVRITNHDDQHVDDTILFPVSISCDMARSLIGSSIASPLHLGSTSTSTRAQIGSPAIIQRPRSPTLPNTFALDSPFLATRARLASRPTHRTRVSTDYSPSVFASPGPAPGAGAGAGVGAGRWHHTMDFERGSTKPETDWTTHHTGQGQEPMQIDANVSITPIDIRITYQDIKTIAALVNIMYRLYATWNASNENETTSTSTSSITSFLANAPADQLTSSIHPQTTMTLSINLASLRTVLIDDCNNRFTPLLSFHISSSSCSLSVQSCTICLVASIPIEIAFYNTKHSQWRAILHPVTVACEARATSSTVTTIDGDEGETENKEKKEEGKEIGEKEKEKSKSRLPIAPFTISLITPSPVDIRLSHTFITTMIDTYQRWKDAWNVNQDVTPFIAYRIINDTGCNICFWTDEDAAMGHAKREIVVGGDATIIEDSVQHRSRTHTKQAGTQTLTLNLAFERTTTMDVLHRIHLEHVGRRAYPLVHVSNAALSANRVLEYVLVDITLIRGCRHITLSSPISLINQTHTPLRFELEAMTEATLENEQNQHQYAVLAHPERELSLPIHLQHWTALCITPQDTNAATYQRTSSITRETQDDITYHIQQLVATDVNGHRMYFHCQSRHEDVDVAVDDIQPEMIITSPTSKPISQTLPHTTLIITAPLQLSNMYPFALTFRLWYSNVAADPHAPTQRLTSPPDTTLLIEQTLTSSASCDVHHINGYASGSYWLQFRMEHFQEYSQYILLPTHVDTRMTRGDIINTSCNDMDGRTYSIVMRIHDPMIGARQLIWCADYWLLNHTDIDLMYAFGDESLMGSNAYTQRMVRVMENQRRTPNGTWDIPYLTTDRPAYSDVDGHVMSSPDTNEAPKGWSWNDTKWNVVIEPQRTDVDGWMYADEFTSHEWFPTSTSPSTSTCHVRRREWIRQAIKTKAPMLYCEGLDAAQRNASTQPMSLYVPSGPSSTLIQRSLTGMEENSWVSVLHPPSPSGISHRSDIGIHVATAPGKYSTTRVITFTPRYIIVNHSNIPLHIGQAGCNDIMMAIAAGQQQALHWDDATKADTGLIRINPDPTEWCDSAPFPIHSIGRLVVKCRHRDIASSIKIKEVQQLMLFAITIRMVDATLVISCELEDLSQPSYRIENKCGLPIQFRQVMNGEEKKEDQQKEEKKEIIETPQPDWFILDNDQSIPHAWDSYASSPPYSLELSLANAPPVYIKPDDMGAYTSISYGANREIIHIYVIVENATNVVRISRTVPMNRGIAFGRTKKSRDDPVRAMSELASQIRLHIPQLNMALIDDTHSTSSRAILSLHIHQLKMAWGMTKQAYKYEFQITCLQINHPIGKLPVIIAIGEKPIKRDDTTSSSTSPCLTFACSRQHGLTYRNHHIPVERYDYVNIEISTIVHVQLEQDGINTMAAYFASLSLDPSWSLPSSSDVSLITPLLQQTDHTLSAHEQQRRSLTHQPHDEIVCEYHVTEFRISPIQAQVTMSWDVTSTNSMSPLLRLFGGLQQTSTPQLLTFPALAFLHQTFTLSEFASMIPIHYNRTSSHVRLIGILPHAPSERFAVASYIDPHYIFGDLTQSMLKGVKPLTRVMSRTKLRVSTGTLPVAATATSISADENDTTTSSSGVDSPFQDLLKSTQQLGRGLISLIRAPVRMVQHGWAERVKTLLGTADRAQDAEEENVTSGTMKPPKPAGLTRVMTSTISFKDPMARIAV